MSAACRMLQGNVPINATLEQSADASGAPDVSQYWAESLEDLGRGVSLGQALDREPLRRNERVELASLSDLEQVAAVTESI